MPLYSFKGLHGSGREIKSTINSDNLVSAKQRIKAQGIMLLSIEEQKTATQGPGFTSNLLSKKVDIEELSLMTRQLATLIKAKIQIVQAVSALIDQTSSEQLKIILSEIKQKVNEGSSLANALSAYPKVFSNVYINMVEAGETSGTLEIVLSRLAEFTDGQVKLKNKIKSAMIYPLIMVTVGATLMGFIFVFVIPKITKIFVSMKKELPLQTQLCIWISDIIQNYWFMIIIGIAILYYSLKKYITTREGKNKWDRLLLKMPVLGTLITMINVSRFCSTLATLLNAGVPILLSMRIVKNLVSNVHMQYAVGKAGESVSEGSSLAGPLSKSGLYPPMVIHMISLGEKSGELSSMLKIVAKNYEDEVENKLSGLTSILEPVMMVCMGGAVGFIIFSVVAPMMELNTLR
ncbi:MAG: type II secretion system inner membrane protein GspF [Halobacteriovoraceae bacterium]|nr:type II secretion system inner membrane protein GspF [Halobacteriovoraceae bacterium]